MIHDVVGLFLCNGCGSIQIAGDAYPAEMMVRVADPRTGEQTEALYLLCRSCKERLGKGKRLHPEG